MSLHSTNLRRRALSSDTRWSGTDRGVHALVLLIIVAGLLLGLPARGVAVPDDPLRQIHDGLNQVIEVFQKKDLSLAARREALRRLAEQHFAFADMARSVLGYHWRTLSPAQRASFVPLFTTFIEDAFLSKLEDYTVQRIQQEASVAKITYLRETFDGPEYAQVFTDIKVSAQKDPLHVNYLMHRTDGSWRVYDITIDAISVTGNYRNQFNRVINNEGYDQLLVIMREKIEGFREHMEHPSQSPAA